jgi:hypothetical protein
MTAKIIENLAYRDRVFVFRDRLQAGKLQDYAGNEDIIVLAIPAGGVPGHNLPSKRLMRTGMIYRMRK